MPLEMDAKRSHTKESLETCQEIIPMLEVGKTEAQTHLICTSALLSFR
ncbi:hypothetical protein [Stenomitos frigidus]|nr:hypothetical protein [Stenomitos frigidus]